MFLARPRRVLFGQTWPNAILCITVSPSSREIISSLKNSAITVGKVWLAFGDERVHRVIFVSCTQIIT